MFKSEQKFYGLISQKHLDVNYVQQLFQLSKPVRQIFQIYLLIYLLKEWMSEDVPHLN